MIFLNLLFHHGVVYGVIVKILYHSFKSCYRQIIVV